MTMLTCPDLLRLGAANVYGNQIRRIVEVAGGCAIKTQSVNDFSLRWPGLLGQDGRAGLARRFTGCQDGGPGPPYDSFHPFPDHRSTLRQRLKEMGRIPLSRIRDALVSIPAPDERGCVNMSTLGIEDDPEVRRRVFEAQGVLSDHVQRRDPDYSDAARPGQRPGDGHADSQAGEAPRAAREIDLSDAGRWDSVLAAESVDRR